MVKVLERIGKIEDELFDLKKELYKEPPKKFIFYDDLEDIEKINQAVRKVRKEIWKEKYAGRI